MNTKCRRSLLIEVIDMKKQLFLLGGLLSVGGIVGFGCEETGKIHVDRSQISELDNGLNCYSHEQCKSKFCKIDDAARICADKLQEGNPCREDDLCADELVCKEDVDGDNKCLRENSENVKPGLNQECTSECANDYVCEESEADENLKYCKVNIGDSCNDTDNCVKIADCVGSSDKKCLILEKKSCTQNQHDTCISGFCKKGENDTYTCEKKLTENTSCSVDMDICDEGLECRLERTDALKDTKCLPILPNLGEDCTQELGCKEGLECQSVSDTENKCKVSTGYECSENNDCINDHECRKGNNEEDTPKTCIELPGFNELCVDHCKTGLECQSVSDTENKCKVSTGYECSENNDCINDHECRKGNNEEDTPKTCIELPDLNEPCVDHCKTGLVCSAMSASTGKTNICKRSEGEICVEEDDCGSGVSCRTGNDREKRCLADDYCDEHYQCDDITETCTGAKKCEAIPCQENFVEHCSGSDNSGGDLSDNSGGDLIVCENDKLVRVKCSRIQNKSEECMVDTTDEDNKVPYCPYSEHSVVEKCLSVGTEPFFVCIENNVAKVVCIDSEGNGNSYKVRIIESTPCQKGTECVEMVGLDDTTHTAKCMIKT